MINEKHPKYPEFKEKWDQVVNESREQIRLLVEVLEQYKPYDPKGMEIILQIQDIDRETHKRTKKLKEEYSFLYE